MKKREFILTAVATVVSPMSAFAGGSTGGATEVTQIANNVELMLQYALQIEEFTRQGLQLQAQLQNLIQNPLGLLGNEVGAMINQIGSIMSAGNSIGSNLSQITSNFATTFKNPGAVSLANGYTKWHKTSIDTLEGALKAAGLQNQRFKNETSKIQALYDDAKNADGNLTALQSLAAINSHQLKQMQGLGQLVAAQNIATSTFMAEQTTRKKARDDRVQAVMGTGNLPLPQSGDPIPGLD